MITASELAEHRADAESRMGAENGASTGRVRRPAGTYVKKADGYEVPAWVDVIATTPLRIGGGSTRSRTQQAGGVEVEVPNRTASFPYGTTGLRDGDYIDITDGANAGQVFRIIESDQADQQTAVRVEVAGVKRPTEWEEVA